LIPVVIGKALAGQPIPVYGKGENVRDWLHVSDHANALRLILENGRMGESYNVGGSTAEGRAECTNLELVKMVCALLDELSPAANGKPRAELISFVTDRPGHDLRYAINSEKIQRELGWKPQQTLNSGMRATVAWYLHNRDFYDRVEHRYAGQRLGLGSAPKTS
jgi:dTDP-glucose 4,6-dehydratase